MNLVTNVVAYLIGMFVPYITSTGVILGLNKTIDKTTKYNIFRTNCIIEGSSVIMAYYGIQSSKSSIAIEIDNFVNININLLLTIILTICLIISIYIFAIHIYIALPKGKAYKLAGGYYLLTYICLSTNIYITILMLTISIFSMFLLKKAPPITRSLSFVLTSFIR